MWRDVFEEMRRMERMMNRLFEEVWFGRPSRLALPRGEIDITPFEALDYREPFADVVETDKEVVVTAEIPGVDKNEIKIHATDNTIEISAEKKREEKEEKKGYLRRERTYSRFYRTFTLPSKVDSSKAKATYKNGVLEVILPKLELPGEKKSLIKVE